MIALASLWLTPNEHRAANGFTWEPIAEVAKLFAAIFVAIIPVQAMLQAGRGGPFAFLLAAVTANDGLPHEAAYFWLTGILSAFLDNAPTYLVFFELAGGDRESVDGPARRHARGDLDGRGLHGRADLHRQRAELHGLRDRRGARHPHAELLCLSSCGPRSRWCRCSCCSPLLPIAPILKLF